MYRGMINSKSDNRMTFDNYYVETQAELDAINLCREYASRFDDAMETGASVVLVGKAPYGKRHLAYSIAREVIKSGRRVNAATAACLQNNLLNADLQKYLYKTEDVCDFMRLPDLLIIDDVGRHASHVDYMDFICTVIELRLSWNRPVAVVGHGTEEDLSKFMGSRILGMLKESSGPFIVCDWHIPRRPVWASK